ncbi:MAG: rRNA maturation RNase YbeY [Kiritimatiellae bacterium]|nr:rRNA maturation RNase YbeY [Kiritimatiellia bacterium]
MDDTGIAAVNRAHLGEDRPTDVISFSYDPLPGETARSGEILVNVEQACREGRRRGGASRELALYVVHGCLHLAGETDDTPAARARMRRHERAWLAKARAAGMTEELFEQKVKRRVEGRGSRERGFPRD